jgi:hypothetical protein
MKTTTSTATAITAAGVQIASEVPAITHPGTRPELPPAFGELAVAGVLALAEACEVGDTVGLGRATPAVLGQ